MRERERERERERSRETATSHLVYGMKWTSVQHYVDGQTTGIRLNGLHARTFIIPCLVARVWRCLSVIESMIVNLRSYGR